MLGDGCLPRVHRYMTIHLYINQQQGLIIVVSIAGGFFYQWGGAKPGLSPRFLNSGCVVGAVWALRELFSFMNTYSYAINDDQQLFVRYLLTHPDLVQIDVSTSSMMTAFKQYQFNLEPHTLALVEKRMVVSDNLELWICDRDIQYVFQTISILHVNNRASSAMYAMINHTYHVVVAGRFPIENRTAAAMDMWKSMDLLTK